MTFGIALLPLALAAADPSAADIDHDYERWEQRLRTRVGEVHRLPGGADKNSIGDVVVSFSIGPDGRPADAVIRKSSGSPVFDKAARRVVRLLGPIGQVPSIASKNHRVVLKLSYGEVSTAAADRQLARALDAERRANSRRNLEIVTMAIRLTQAASR